MAQAQKVQDPKFDTLRNDYASASQKFGKDTQGIIKGTAATQLKDSFDLLKSYYKYSEYSGQTSRNISFDSRQTKQIDEAIKKVNGKYGANAAATIEAQARSEGQALASGSAPTTYAYAEFTKDMKGAVASEKGVEAARRKGQFVSLELTEVKSGKVGMDYIFTGKTADGIEVPDLVLNTGGFSASLGSKVEIQGYGVVQAAAFVGLDLQPGTVINEGNAEKIFGPKQTL